LGSDEEVSSYVRVPGINGYLADSHVRILAPAASDIGHLYSLRGAECFISSSSSLGRRLPAAAVSGGGGYCSSLVY